MIVTTEKDAVRFPRLPKTDVPIYFLRVEIEILSGHESWEHFVGRICKPQPLLDLHLRGDRLRRGEVNNNNC
jgi:tetraacyldisaccharide 4'-kinase